MHPQGLSLIANSISPGYDVVGSGVDTAAINRGTISKRASSRLSTMNDRNLIPSTSSSPYILATEPTDLIPQVKKKNAKGGFLATAIDTFISYALMPAPIVKFIKSIGEKLLPRHKGTADLGFGTAGFFIAEETIRRFIDPALDKVAHLLNHTIENKIPKYTAPINEAADHLINKATHTFLGLFSKRIHNENNSPEVNHEHKIVNEYPELREKLEHYLKNGDEIDRNDEMHFPNLVKEMLLADYEKNYGHKMPNFLNKILDLSFHFVSIKSPTRFLLSANGAAEAFKEVFHKILPKPLADSTYELLYNGLPNLYTFIGRPIAIYAINHKKKYLEDFAKMLSIQETVPRLAQLNTQ